VACLVVPGSVPLLSGMNAKKRVSASHMRRELKYNFFLDLRHLSKIWVFGPAICCESCKRFYLTEKISFLCFTAVSHVFAGNHRFVQDHESKENLFCFRAGSQSKSAILIQISEL
jgi:hypothetical protein